MRILFVTPFVPGPNVDHAGGRDLFYFMKALAVRNEVSLLGLELGDGMAADQEALRQFCRHVEIVPLRNGAAKLARYLGHFKWPRAVAMFYSPELAQRLSMWLGRMDFDVIQFENIQTIPYAEQVTLPTVLDCIDLNFLPLFQQHLAASGSILRRLHRAFEWPRLQLYEARACRRFSGFITRSDRDATFLKAFNPGAVISVRHGTWPVTFELAIDESRPRPRPRPARPVVMFVGAMWRSVNSDACHYFLDRIWPAVRRALPEAEFQIVGASPPASLSAYSGRDNVHVTGYVTDLLPWYRQCSVLVVPLLAAGGVITKIVDAMLVGLPVVATSVANQGINAARGRDILIGDDSTAFADALIRVLTDDQLYSEISTNSEAFMEKFFDWDASIRATESLYREVASRHRSIAAPA
jgi:glycosyltransferase involved in cell wall biosynthesis